MLRLSDEAYVAETSSGVCVLTYRGLLYLDGDAAGGAEVMGALGSGQTLEQVLADVSPQRRSSAEVLARLLCEHGALIPSGTAWYAGGSGGAAFLRAVGEYSRSGLERYRRSVVFVVGSGVLAEAVAAALRESGVGEVRVILPGVTLAGQADRADLAVQVVDLRAGQDAQGRWADDRCVTDGVPLCQVAIDGVAAYWSPVEAPCEAPGLDAALRRVVALGSRADHGCTVKSVDLDGAFVAVVAAQVAHDVFRYSSGARPHTIGTMKIVDRLTLRTSEHRVVGHPYDVSARQLGDDHFRARLADLRAHRGLTRDELDEGFHAVSDGRVGPVACLDDGIADQLPLRASAVRISDPAGLLGARTVTVAGVGTDAAMAVDQARLRALAAYGSVMIDPRLLVDRHGGFISAPDADPLPVLHAVGQGAVGAFARAVDLTDGRTRLVPAHLAFPVLRAATSSEPYRVACGTAAGHSWDQAVTNALLQHCLRLTVDGHLRRSRTPGDLTPRRFEHDPTVRFCLDMLRAAELDVTLSDVTGPLGVPVVACRSGSGEYGYGCGLNLAHAVREALTGQLLRYQARKNPGLEAALATMPAPILTTSDAACRGDAARTTAQIAGLLEGAGLSPAVFALDHDPVVHEAMPYVVRVVLESADA
ncbi:YcaO-like family protein [Streptomyces sp. NPDC002659]|uniref:YcaO-like family protein n=1 Tax=Streptomyces sp. NPDC002659 TaxID=3364656 RepID=UPI003693123F